MTTSTGLRIESSPAPASSTLAWTSVAPLVVIDDLLGRARARQVLDYAIAHQARFTRSRVSLRHDGVVDTSRRVSLVCDVLDDLMPALEPTLRRVIDAAIPALGLVNVEGYALESELAWSGNGGFFRRHTDTLRYRRSHRVMTLVYYVHRRPKVFSGGQLQIYGLGALGGVDPEHEAEARADREPCHEIEPQWDRAVLFPSWFPHEVRAVRSDSDDFGDGRFALTVWVHKTH